MKEISLVYLIAGCGVLLACAASQAVNALAMSRHNQHAAENQKTLEYFSTLPPKNDLL